MKEDTLPHYTTESSFKPHHNSTLHIIHNHTTTTVHPTTYYPIPPHHTSSSSSFHFRPTVKDLLNHEFFQEDTGIKVDLASKEEAIATDVGKVVLR